MTALRIASVMFMAALALGCESGRGTLVVQVRTDLIPGHELAMVRVMGRLVGGSPLLDQSLSAAESRTWGTGTRVAELPDLAPGSYRLLVSALGSDGTVLVERPVRVDLTESVRVVTVLLTRDCMGVECPGSGDAEAVVCLAGRCVPENCTEDLPESCGTSTCISIMDCPAPGPRCVGVECTPSGVCFTVLDPDECEAGETCSPRSGCVPTAAPIVVANAGLRLDSGDTAALSRAVLAATHRASPPDALVFSITSAPTGGALERADAPGSPLTDFTQADVDAGYVVYAHAGGPDLTDAFDFSVSDGGPSSAVETFQITVAPSPNQPPVAQEDPGDYLALVGSAPHGFFRLADTDLMLARDSSATGNDGGYRGTPTLGATSVLLPAAGDSSVSFSGADDYVLIPFHATYTSAPDATISLWFQVSALGAGQGLFSTDHAGEGGFTIRLDASGEVHAHIGAIGGDVILRSDPVAAGGWHNVVVTVTGVEGELYVDGELAERSAPVSFGAAADDPIVIGASMATSATGDAFPITEHFRGLIDEILLFPTRLGRADVLALFHSVRRNYQIVQGLTLVVNEAQGVLANDYDPDDDELDALPVDRPPGALYFVLNLDGSFDYQSTSTFTGEDIFTYRASDEAGAVSAITTVRITVVP